MIDVEFIDSGREATEKPDPKYPYGRRIDLTTNMLARQCTSNMPYPAPRCGMYRVTCKTCGYSALITVAGRPDDPNIITLPCKGN